MRNSSFYQNIKRLYRGYKTIARLRPWLIPAICFKAAVSAAAPIITIRLSALIIDALAEGAGTEVFLSLALPLVIINLAAHQINKGIDSYKTLQQRRLRSGEESIVLKVCLNTDYENFENPAFMALKRDYDEIVRINGNLLAGCLTPLEDALTGLFSVTLAAYIAAPLLMIGGGLLAAAFALIVIAAALCDFIFKKKNVDELYRLKQGVVLSNRMIMFYGSLAIFDRGGMEVRLFRAQEMIKRKATAGLQGDSVLSEIGNTDAKFGSLSALALALLNGVIYIYVGLSALAGRIGVGGIVQYVGAVTRFTNSLTDMLTAISQMHSCSKYLRYLFDIEDTEPVKYKGSLTVEKRGDFDYDIEFRNVSFKYPGSDVWALRNLSLKLEKGKRLAVVGENGSGKSTMIKLLCRFYDPQEGEITLNGIDIRKYIYSEYMTLFSVVFQDFALFGFPVWQNVASSWEADMERVALRLRQVGFTERLSRLPLGLETPLFKDFEPNAVDISGGEEQQLALARALYKPAPFIALDEPTAALDPIAEHEIYSSFNELVGGHTAVYISHRLSSCRFCDTIAVFDSGRLVQKGSHSELSVVEGKYRELWNAQAQYYLQITDNR